MWRHAVRLGVRLARCVAIVVLLAAPHPASRSASLPALPFAVGERFDYRLRVMPFGTIGHGLCALCYFLSLTADESPWTFVTFVALAAFCNDLTMGAAWASCIDIGGKYAGIVSGCMNTVGNLGGAVAGFATGWALDHYKRTDTPDMGWTVNFISYGVVYLIAVLLWLRFDATKQVAQEC